MLSEVCTPLLTPIMKYKCVRNVITKADVTRGRRKIRGSRKHILDGKKKTAISKHASCEAASFESRLWCNAYTGFSQKFHYS
jgi:hypothetical protein